MVQIKCPECSQMVVVIGGIVAAHERPSGERMCEQSWVYMRDALNRKHETDLKKVQR